MEQGQFNWSRDHLKELRAVIIVTCLQIFGESGFGQLKPKSNKFVDNFFQPKQVVVHPLHFAGKPFESKLSGLRTEIEKSGSAAMVVTELDEIAWLFNLRGEGKSFNNSNFLCDQIWQNFAIWAILFHIWQKKKNCSAKVLGHLGKKNYGQISYIVIWQNFTIPFGEILAKPSGHTGSFV